MTYEFLCRNETYFLLNFIQLKFFFLLAELYSSRNSSGNLHPQWPWGTAHEERDMLPVWWQRRHLRMSGYQKVSICYQLMILLLSASEVQPLVSAVKSFVVLDLIRVSTLSWEPRLHILHPSPPGKPFKASFYLISQLWGEAGPSLKSSGSKSINQPLQACTELLCMQPCW